MSRVSLLEQHAIELLAADPEWRAFRFEHRLLTIYLEGGIAPTFSRGPRKGQRNWAKRTDVRSIEIPHDHHDRWIKAWQERTGLCSRCEGRGEVFACWNLEIGVTYRKCPVCAGDGKKP